MNGIKSDIHPVGCVNDSTKLHVRYLSLLHDGACSLEITAQIDNFFEEIHLELMRTTIKD